MIQKLVVLSAFFTISTLTLTAQSNHKFSTTDYVERYKDLAVKEMKRTGIPASITMAQGVLESGNGNSTLARKSNNHFGIKCHNNWNGKKVYHDDDRRNECFRKYNTVYESYVDHSDFLIGKQRYAFLFDLKTTDYKAWAHGLKKAGYATDPKYAHRLIDIIEKNKLYLLDEDKVWKRKDGKKRRMTVGKDHFVIKPFNTHATAYNNGIKYIEVEDGDTFDAIAGEFGMRQWELYRYNDLPDNANIDSYRYLYIQPKKGRAHRKHEFHVVKEGETLHYISQKYGLKMKKLLRFNHLKEGARLKAGDRLNLRRKKK